MGTQDLVRTLEGRQQNFDPLPQIGVVVAGCVQIGRARAAWFMVERCDEDPPFVAFGSGHDARRSDGFSSVSDRQCPVFGLRAPAECDYFR